MSAGRTLVAGVGNIFLGDDGFGVETVRRLVLAGVPDGVDVVDVGVRGVHLAYQLLDGYGTVVLVDAASRGGAPGTVYLIEAQAGPVEPSGPAALDGHRMGPDAVLALLATLSASTGGVPPERVLVVGCEPASLEEGIGLSAPVAAGVEQAVRLIRRVVSGEAVGDRAVGDEAVGDRAVGDEAVGDEGQTVGAEPSERKAPSC